MRITNKMMSNNSQININKNKELEDKLNTQMSTQKKITRPSDDPVIAIRALRLRGNLNEITQYYEKNIPDASAWLEVTESALKETKGVIDDMYEYSVQGSNGELTAEDRLKLLENLKELRNQIYSSGNADYAGRTVFTGYRTGEKLTFTESTTDLYRITEKFTKDDIEEVSYIKGKADIDLTNSPLVGIPETDVQESTAQRIRLSYDGIDNLNCVNYTIGGVAQTPLNVVTVAKTDVNAYDVAGYNAAQTPATTYDAIFIAETGELILSDASAATLKTADGITMEYDKKEWEKGDLKPQHYFNCDEYGTQDPAAVPAPTPIQHRDPTEGQIIEYDISFNQSLRVNTLASEVYTHDISRDVDELIAATEAVIAIEDKKKKLEAMKSETAYSDDANQAAIDETLTAVEKEYTFAKENMKNMFQHSITQSQGYLDTTNLAIANCGARGKRLELTESRMKEQQTSFSELASKNENVNVADVAIELASAELAYDAALMATGKIAQQTLLNYL